MNLTKKSILALGLVFAGVSFAQQTAETTGTQPVGLLGQKYSEVSFGVSDIRHYSKNQYGVGVAGNVPVSSFLDFTAGYDYSWLRNVGHTNSVFAGATAYTTMNGVKPFVGAALGYAWDSYGWYRDDYANWGVGAGIEIPAGALSITPRIVYADDFRDSNDSSEQWSYGVEANYWVNRSTSVFAAVDHVDVRGTSNDANTFTAGARFKF